MLMTTAAVLLGGAVQAEDNQLTKVEQDQGWILLFDGKSLNGWQTSSQKPSKRPVEDQQHQPAQSGGYMMIHDKQWGDFVLCARFQDQQGLQ